LEKYYVLDRTLLADCPPSRPDSKRTDLHLGNCNFCNFRMPGEVGRIAAAESIYSPEPGVEAFDAD
jgi:hypothetical protein